MANCVKPKIMPDTGREKNFNNNSYEAGADSDINIQGRERLSTCRNVKRRAQPSKILCIL